MKKTALATLGTLLVTSRLFASSGTEGAAFLDIPVGAGPAALGSAYSASAENAYAPVYNPAGLASLRGHEIAAQHLSYLESIHYEHFSYVLPLGTKGGVSTRGLGFSVQYLGSGDIAATSDTGGDMGQFSSHYASYNLAYGHRVMEKLAVGATGKIISAKIDDVSAHAYAMDFGSLYTHNDKLQFAATLTNLGTKLKFISEGDSLPMAFKVAGQYKPTRKWMVTSEGVYRKNGLASFHVGGQWRPIEAVSLRTGYKTDTLNGLSALAGLTAGVGIHVWGQELAYAWSPYGDLGDAQYLSLLVRFGAAEEAKRNLIQYRTIRKHQTVRNVPNTRKDDIEPEYQQLMQLLADDDASHVAEAVKKRATRDY